MRVMIAGAGQVGRRVAATLAETHEVVLVDDDATVLDGLAYDLDVLTVLGDCSAIETLEEAGIATAELLIASSDSDEINILTCETAKALTDVTTVARVKNVKYIDTWDRVDDVDVVVAALAEDSEANLLAALRARREGVARSVANVGHGEHADLFEDAGVDVAVNPRRATAEEIVEFARDQDTQNVALLEDGAVEVIEIQLDDESVLVGRPIAQAIDDLPSGVVVGAITRNGSFLAPRGDTVIESGDHVIVLAEGSAVEGAIALL
jgi:trk system potassium uptake protein TrkA